MATKKPMSFEIKILNEGTDELSQGHSVRLIQSASAAGSVA
ncbi:MAG TPA: hypothetical protein VHW95_06630 [Steroidobacteraceae bacterium]|jgi:hypothetical protein|nr:hypothetical protein [Steroidobacteraceae bacterium]